MAFVQKVEGYNLFENCDYVIKPQNQLSEEMEIHIQKVQIMGESEGISLPQMVTSGTIFFIILLL